MGCLYFTFQVVFFLLCQQRGEWASGGRSHGQGPFFGRAVFIKLTWRLLCISFLFMTCFLIRGILPKNELHRSPKVKVLLLSNEFILEAAQGLKGSGDSTTMEIES